MSNKPPVYGFCPAGCKWETVHKEDWIDGTTYVKKSINSYLDKGTTYKIENTTVETDYNFEMFYHYKENIPLTGVVDRVYTFTLPVFDNYKQYVKFILLDATLNVGATQITLIYEMNDTRSTITISNTNDGILQIGSAYVNIRSRTQESSNYSILQINEDANITFNYGTSDKIQKVVDQNTYSVEFDVANEPIYRHINNEQQIDDTKKLVTDNVTNNLEDRITALEDEVIVNVIDIVNWYGITASENEAINTLVNSFLSDGRIDKYKLKDVYLKKTIGTEYGYYRLSSIYDNYVNAELYLQFKGVGSDLKSYEAYLYTDDFGANWTIEESQIAKDLTIDSTPIAGSTHLVTSGGIKTYVDNAISTAITVALGDDY